jgi:hypothetical protein
MGAATPQAGWHARLLIGAGLLFVAAGIIAFYIVPPDGPPVAEIFFGALLLGTSLLARPHDRTGRVIAGLAGLVALWGSANALYMGVFWSHRPDMRGVAVPMAFAAACELAAAVLALWVTGLFHRSALALRRVWWAARSHPWTAALALACWLALLSVAAVAWFWERAVWNPIFDLCVIVSIPISLLIGSQIASVDGPDERRLVDGLFAGGVMALIVMELNQVLFVTWDIVSYLSQPTLPELGERHEWPVYLAVAVGWLLGYGVQAVAQGAIAGLVGAGLVVLWQRWRGRRGPAPSASTP